MRFGYTTIICHPNTDTLELHDMGQQGWQLCVMIPDEYGKYKYYFKRELID